MSTRSTLARAQDSMLAAYASGRFQGQKDELGYWFIDRDPTHFRHILNFLRDGTHILHSGGLLQHPPYELRQVLIEANFYHIKQLAEAIGVTNPYFPRMPIYDVINRVIERCNWL